MSDRDRTKKFARELIDALTEREERRANEFVEALRGKKPAEQSKEPPGDERYETLKRKAQYLIDVAYNRALDDMVDGDTTGTAWARRVKLRRTVRHAAEFGGKST